MTAQIATDYLGLALPVMLAVYRIGCLVGGCCYGRPSPGGITYDSELVVAARTRWRRFDPGPAPNERVLPLQLVDSGINIVIAAALFMLAANVPPPVPLLPAFLGSYSAARLAMERLRGHRHRPIYGPLSEAQWTALIVIAASGIWMGVVV
ncbi:prolipoprotein diacylglyceryl transferase family protein [Streptomyces sp. TLI_171]|uniref:prolipoprotein diacylglyceryl transferase family protein n=1 Tax=Streptomyces sp. TLI_171 TaxID=1938859 RepID=UPI0037DA1EA2